MVQVDTGSEIYCTVLAVLVGFTDYATQLFTVFYCRLCWSVFQSFVTSSFDPLMSCVRAVFRCPLASSAGCRLLMSSGLTILLLAICDSVLAASSVLSLSSEIPVLRWS
jgi:hypothetical protein